MFKTKVFYEYGSHSVPNVQSIPPHCTPIDSCGCHNKQNMKNKEVKQT